MGSAGKQFYEEALALEEAGNAPAAFDAFRRSAKADPSIAAPYVGLARILASNHQKDQAIACLDQAAACEPGNLAVQVVLARTLSEAGRHERACEVFEKVLRQQPENNAALIGLGAVFEDLGRREDAGEMYRRLLALDSKHAEALAGLLAVTGKEQLPEAIGQAERALKSADDRSTALVGYALGKAHARIDDPDPAFAAWARANAARRREAGAFDREAFERRIDDLMGVFDEDFFRRRSDWGTDSRLPVFIVGLPRSGTTLVEQILAAHPSVHGAGEVGVLTDLATGLPDRLGRPEPAWPHAALELDAHGARSVGDDLAARLQALALSEITRVVDKQPLNFWHLGLVALALPQATVLNCQRDIRDGGLSIFAENFTPAQRWGTDLSDIACYWRGYRRLMNHWREVCELQIHDVQYEDVVEDLEGQARKIVGELGLAWDDNVLAFHMSARAVQTPSRWQVRQPIYSGSSGKWRDYEAHLGPLVSAADEVA